MTVLTKEYIENLPSTWRASVKLTDYGRVYRSNGPSSGSLGSLVAGYTKDELAGYLFRIGQHESIHYTTIEILKQLVD